MSTRARNRVVPAAALVIMGLLIAASILVLDARRTTTAVAASPGTGTTTSGSPTAAAAATAPTPVPTSGPPAATIPLLLMIGDSITYSAEDPLARTMWAAGFAPSIQAFPGHLFRDRVAPARAAATAHPDIVVFNLGTNDHICLQEENASASQCVRYPGFSPADHLADVDALLAVFPNDSTCIVAVSPTTAPETEALLPQLAAQGRIDGIADWGTVSRTNTQYLWDPVGHINESGQVAYAQFVTAEAHRICDPLLAPGTGPGA